MDFVKLVKIQGVRFTIRTDNIDDISELFTNQRGIDIQYVLVVDAAGERYHLDLGRLMLHHHDLNNVATIHEFIDQLTPVMLYSFQTDIFYLNHPIRSFTSADLPEPVTITPYNDATDIEAKTSYDPKFPDLLIKEAGYDLTMVFPVIDGRIKACKWRGQNIVIPGGAELARSTTQLTFLSFAETNFTVKSLRQLITSGQLASRQIPLLVLGGSLFYHNPFVYRFTHNPDRFELNLPFLEQEYQKFGYVSVDEWIDDPDSFVILVEANQVYMREISLVSIPSKCPPTPYCYHATGIWDRRLDHICLDSQNYRVRGLTKVSEHYQRIVSTLYPHEHHVYVDLPHQSRVHLMQLVVC